MRRDTLAPIRTWSGGHRKIVPKWDIDEGQRMLGAGANARRLFAGAWVRRARRRRPGAVFDVRGPRRERLGDDADRPRRITYGRLTRPSANAVGLRA